MLDTGASLGLLAPRSSAYDLLGHRYTKAYIDEMITPVDDSEVITDCEGKVVRISGQTVVEVKYKEQSLKMTLTFAENMSSQAGIIMGIPLIIKLGFKLIDNEGVDVLRAPLKGSKAPVDPVKLKDGGSPTVGKKKTLAMNLPAPPSSLPKANPARENVKILTMMPTSEMTNHKVMLCKNGPPLNEGTVEKQQVHNMPKIGQNQNGQKL
ncbi:MAG: hypothetical protein GY820_47080, partial [Gammaproteobacteria bacterium]|nr:hypothetical protein [Gammaproteobacteria bacterium]